MLGLASPRHGRRPRVGARLYSVRHTAWSPRRTIHCTKVQNNLGREHLRMVHECCILEQLVDDVRLQHTPNPHACCLQIRCLCISISSREIRVCSDFHPREPRYSRENGFRGGTREPQGERRSQRNRLGHEVAWARAPSTKEQFHHLELSCAADTANRPLQKLQPKSTSSRSRSFWNRETVRFCPPVVTTFQDTPTCRPTSRGKMSRMLRKISPVEHRT